MVKVPNIRLNNGIQMPIIGLGTWKSPPGEVAQAVKAAFDVGYRHFDCAHVYENEKEIGGAFSEKMGKGKINRKDVFITSKLWNTHHRYGAVEPAIKTTLNDLQLDYLDLYLIHWPMGFKEDEGLFPLGEDGFMKPSSIDYTETWKAMEEINKKGLAKAIGLSNFNKRQIERILHIKAIIPAINQIECHPYLTNIELSKFCKRQGIEITAYSPLGSPDRPWAKPDDPKLLDDPKLKAIAQKYNKTTAQVVIRYQIDLENVVIPKSVTPNRIKENFNVFDFKLSPADIVAITSFDVNGRICPFTDATNHEHHPFVRDQY